MPVTLSDVAKLAGVSKKTASRVINNESGVANNTRKKVLAAIDELGFVPNRWAQRLASGQSGLIGFLVFDTTPAYNHNIMDGLLDVGDEKGYHLSIIRLDIEQEEQINEVITLAKQKQVEGFVFTPPCDNSEFLLDELTKINFPFVLISPHKRDNDYAWISPTDEQGSYEATWHLVRLGHRRIGFIQGQGNHQSSQLRLFGFQRAMNEAGIEINAAYVKKGDWEFSTGLRLSRELLSLPERPSAIMAGNDVVAAAVIQAAWERGLSCPNDVSVVGFDDLQLAAQVCPPLTTVRQSMYTLGEIAMKILVEDLIPGKESSQSIEIPTELIIRHSTAAYSE